MRNDKTRGRQSGSRSGPDLSCLLSTLVTAAKVEGSNGKWEYCFYNVYRPQLCSVVHLKVTSRSLLPETLQQGFSLGCGRIVREECLTKLTGLSLDDVKIIGSMANCVPNNGSTSEHALTRKLISLLEMHGLDIRHLAQALELIEVYTAEAHGQPTHTCDPDWVDTLKAHKISMYPRSDFAEEITKKWSEATAFKLKRLLDDKRRGKPGQFQARAEALARLGSVGLGELSDILHPPSLALGPSIDELISRRIQELESLIQVLPNEAIPLEQLRVAADDLAPQGCAEPTPEATADAHGRYMPSTAAWTSMMPYGRPAPSSADVQVTALVPTKPPHTHRPQLAGEASSPFTQLVQSLSNAHRQSEHTGWAVLREQVAARFAHGPTMSNPPTYFSPYKKDNKSRKQTL